MNKLFAALLLCSLAGCGIKEDAAPYVPNVYEVTYADGTSERIEAARIEGNDQGTVTFRDENWRQIAILSRPATVRRVR